MPRLKRTRQMLLATLASSAFFISACEQGRPTTLVPFTDVDGQQDLTESTARLVVRNRVGDVTVMADTTDEVRVEAKVKINPARATDTRRGDFADHVRLTVSENTVMVADAHAGQPDENDWGVSLVVHVPGRLAVNVTNGVGNINVTDTQSDLKLEGGVGNVSVKSTDAGDVIAEGGMGDVTITLGRVTGIVKAVIGTGAVTLAVDEAPTNDVTLTGGMGDVRLKIPAGSAGTFRLVVGIGSINVTGHKGIVVTRSVVSAEGRGVIGEGGPTYTLKTGTGTVVVE